MFGPRDPCFCLLVSLQTASSALTKELALSAAKRCAMAKKTKSKAPAKKPSAAKAKKPSAGSSGAVVEVEACKS